MLQLKSVNRVRLPSLLRLTLLLPLAIVSASNGPAFASWTPNGAPIIEHEGDTQVQELVPDGASGAFVVTWDDNTPEPSGIRIQRLTPAGVAIDWPQSGVLVCGAPDIQAWPVAVPDGSGGLYVTWQDSRSGATDIYVQRIAANGAPSPGWPVDGTLVCGAQNTQRFPSIAVDGAGGCYVAWEDERDGVWGAQGPDIYVHHFDAAGTADSGWPVNGLPVTVEAGQQYGAKITSDGMGGVIVAWIDGGQAPQAIRAQRFTNAAAWPAPITLHATAGVVSSSPKLLCPNPGRVFAVWSDTGAGGGRGIRCHSASRRKSAARLAILRGPRSKQRGRALHE